MIRKLQHEGSQFLRATPRILLVGALVMLAYFPTPLMLLFLLGLVFMEGMIVVMKHGSRTVLGPAHPLGARPSKPEGGCGVFYKPGTWGSQSYGMPSGHAAVAAFAATFWILYLVRNRSAKWFEKEELVLSLRVLLVTVLALMVIASRVVAGCHTGPQVMVGSVAGVLVGWGAYELKRVWDVDTGSNEVNENDAGEEGETVSKGDVDTGTGDPDKHKSQGIRRKGGNVHCVASLTRSLRPQREVGSR